jgi:transcriptional repressor NrdR
MRCPYCDAGDTRVIDSRPSGEAVRRRRACESCGNRFTTYERVEMSVAVVKRDGSRQPFDPEKVRHGVERALADRPVPEGSVDALVRRVESLAAATGPLIHADEIGREVLEGLRELDEVAYVRFASVYKEFSGVRDFEREVAALEGD